MDILRLHESRLTSRIVKLLDIHALAASCCVCKDWYQYLNEDEEFWKEACKNYGLQQDEGVQNGDWHSWKEYAFIVIRRERNVRTSACFREFTEVNASDVIISIYFHGNRLAVATSTDIEIWGTEPPRTFMFAIDTFIHRNRWNSSVKIDDHHIVVADTDGGMKNFDFESRHHTATYERQNPPEGSPLTSYDFESESDIVVGSFLDDDIHIWRLSTGTLLKKIQFATSNSVAKVKTVLMRGQQDNDQGLLYLFALHIDKLLVWTFTIHDIHNGAIEYSVLPSPIHEYERRMSATYFRRLENVLNHERHFLYYPVPANSERPRDIARLDLNRPEDCTLIPRPPEKIEVLLAVGEKYVAYLIEDRRTVHVMEISSGKLVATFALTRISMNFSFQDAEARNVVFCGRAWMDGIDVTNDRGTTLAYVSGGEKQNVTLIEWIPRPEFAA